ncbi:MAG: hypothetical protein K9J79_00590 [Desulfobacteraceae bacterium]|nr:hypothetical protein [Desulfobacteraceae bacterium]MCF8093836.1 hypothetical protein [Desulfobacteraceae bacterium]
MAMNDSGWRFTYTLARLYETQGYLQQASEIYAGLQPDDKQKASVSEQFFVSPAKEQTEEFAKLATLMAQWIELLKRSRFVEAKP